MARLAQGESRAGLGQGKKQCPDEWLDARVVRLRGRVVDQEPNQRLEGGCMRERQRERER